MDSINSLTRTGMKHPCQTTRTLTLNQPLSFNLLNQTMKNQNSFSKALHFSSLYLICIDEWTWCRTWRAKQAQEIAEREEKAQGKKEETIAKARNAIDNFYKDYNSKKEKSIAQNKCVSHLPSLQINDWRNGVNDQGGRGEIQIYSIRLVGSRYYMGTNLYSRWPDRFSIENFDEIETRLVEVQGGTFEFEERGRERSWCGWILEDRVGMVRCVCVYPSWVKGSCFLITLPFFHSFRSPSDL